MSKDTQSRKYQLTINNPLDNGAFSHENIISLLQNNFKCMSDEKGLEGETPHTHLYLAFSGGVRFTTIKKHFPTAHIETARGTSQQNRDYIAKEGKWKNDEKHGTKIDGTFDEWGEMPLEHQGSPYADILSMIENDFALDDIREKFPSEYFINHDKIKRIQQEHIKSNQPAIRPMQVSYHYGEPNTGKSYFVRDTFGKDVYVAYADDKNLFDGYTGQSVLCIEEFTGQLPITLINAVLDIYPYELPARYYSRIAQYETVIINSNLPLHKQYQDIQAKTPQLFYAFCRRIHKVIEFLPDYQRREYDTMEFLENNKIKFDLSKSIPLQYHKQAQDNAKPRHKSRRG